MASSSHHNKRAGRIVTAVVLIIAIGLMAYAAVNLATIMYNYREADQTYEEAASLGNVETVPAEEYPEDFGNTDNTSAYDALEAPSVDFAGLLAKEPNVIGWLDVPACGISYPIMQGETNQTYLHSTLGGGYLFAGSIFLDSQNASDFSDSASIIYGHYMKNDWVQIRR